MRFAANRDVSLQADNAERVHLFNIYLITINITDDSKEIAKFKDESVLSVRADCE